jgi:hypothetical protein
MEVYNSNPLNSETCGPEPAWRPNGKAVGRLSFARLGGF